MVFSHPSDSHQIYVVKASACIAHDPISDIVKQKYLCLRLVFPKKQ